MKILFNLILFCFFAVSHAQEPMQGRLLYLTDFELADGRMQVIEKQCLLDDAVNQQVLISVICQKPAFQSCGVDKINSMILFANSKGKKVVPMSHGYVPQEIKMIYNPAINAWSLTNLFVVKDESGTETKNLFTLDFDANGDFIAMKQIF